MKEHVPDLQVELIYVNPRYFAITPQEVFVTAT